MFKTSHTRTVVRECYKDDNESLWKSLKFDPSPRKNTWTDRSQNLNQWLRHIYLPQCNILCIRPGFFSLHVDEIHRESKNETILYSSPNIDRFSNFFHNQTQQETCN